MKIQHAFAAVLLSGLTMSGPAQAAAPAAAGDATIPAAAPVKIAIISFEAVVAQTNEFQRDMADLQKKYEPKRDALKTLNQEIETLQKQLQSQAATLTDAQRENRSLAISEKQKQLQRAQEDDQNDIQQDMQSTFSGVASKVGEVMISYAQQQGYTLVLDGGNQQAQMVLYHNPATDISRAVMDAYNVKSGVPAPPSESLPAAPKPSAGHPSATPQH